MKIKILQKDIIGYVFLLALAAVCITIGARVFSTHHAVAGSFGLALGAALIIAFFSMIIRKE
jgi:uncharacterized membrane protein YvlD (DUF360 family)